MSTSFSLGPPAKSPFALMFQSQFLTSPLWPPSSTDLTHRVAIITGSSSGLGLEASKQLLSFHLSTLILAVRSLSKGENVASQLRAQFPATNIKVWQLEMESYSSIQMFAKKVETELSRLDIVILNAGMQCAEFTIVPSTGHEKVIQVNHLSTMLLAILLLPSLKDKLPAGHTGRLSIVSSGSARGASIHLPPTSSVLGYLDDSSQPWKPIERYQVSKLLGHFSIIDLARYVDPEDVVVNLVDPGLTKNTALQGFAPWPVRFLFWCFKGVVGRRLDVGASTYVDAVVGKGAESHGSLVANWRVSSFAEFIYAPEGQDVGRKLWEEMLAEYEFAGVKGILDGLRNGSFVDNVGLLEASIST